MYKMLLLFLLFVIVHGKKSFTVIIDTTMSMDEEIDIVKSNIGLVLNQLSNSSEVDNYILIHFNDPDVAPPIISSTPNGFMAALDSLVIGGGHDCPENSLAGIIKALEVSNGDSYIFLYTDAYAKDYSKLSVIENLCANTRSQVVTFLSGRCVQSETSSVGSVDVYYDVAKSCSGSFFQLSSSHLRQVFKFMKEIVKVEWTAVDHHVFTSYKEINLPVESLTKEFIITVNGYPSNEVQYGYPVLQIVDRDGNSPIIEKIVDTRQLLVIRMANAEVGHYTVKIRSSTDLTRTTVYRRDELPFRYGFTTKYPRNLKETSLRPLPGQTNYILITVTNISTRLNSVTKHVVNEKKEQPLKLEKDSVNSGFYVTDAVFEPYKSYRISVSGQDTSTNMNFIMSTNVFTPQTTVEDVKWTIPIMEVIELASTTVDYGTNTTLACKATGYPKPIIVWEDEYGTILPSEDILLEIPRVHISYAVIEKLDKNCTYTCKANNSMGEHTKTIELFVKRNFSFDVLQVPKDDAIEYGTEGKLYCEVNAYPEAKTKWYHNDSLIESSENIEITPEDSTLLIKNMSLQDAGVYKCEMGNEMETRSFSAEITISGLEPPDIEVENTEVILKPGDDTEIDCRIIKGKPTPDLTWKYISIDGEISDVPDGVDVEENKLKLAAVKMEHSGTYRCEAINLQGQEYCDINVKVQYAPEINNNNRETLVVKEGDNVELKCDVHAVPSATVRWEMYQDDVMMALDHRHTTDEQHTHRFEALWKDSGKYHCVAENDVGKAEITMNVNVLVAPYIETPESKILSVRVGANVRLTCNVSYGNPVPTTKWEFIAANSSTTTLHRGHSLNTLTLMNVSKGHEGLYLCIADNEVGSDNIRIKLNVRE